MTEEDNGGSGRKVGIAKTLESLGWALFFIWVGMALLLDVGWGVGLLGVGVSEVWSQDSADLHQEGVCQARSDANVYGFQIEI